jgi:hypothetical protein
MTSLYIVAGGVILFVIVIGILVKVSKSSGKSIAERDSLQEGQDRRNAFDKVMEKPAASGRELVSKLRRSLGR